MSLDPRAVATNGLVVSPRLVAVNGLWPLPSPVNPPSGGGGSRIRKSAPRKPHKDDDVLIFLL